ncbi:hypothetical protein CL614_10465 [archaeon]|jgi:hypothetical protein|nr:hypothetical protein [archaeon]
MAFSQQQIDRAMQNPNNSINQEILRRVGTQAPIQQVQPQRTTRFGGVLGKFESVGQRIGETIQDIQQTGSGVLSKFTSGADQIAQIDKTQPGVVQAVESFGVGTGTAAGIFDEVFQGILKVALSPKQEESAKEVLTKFGESSLVQNVAQEVQQASDFIKSVNPDLHKGLVAGINTILLGTEIAGAGVTKKVGTEILEQSQKRIFDTTKSVAERLKNVRKAIDDVPPPPPPPPPKPTTPSLPEPTIVPIKEPTSFINNPTVTGAIDDIKIMVGLPGSTPAVDLTFRAVKPRLTKKINLRRVKAQMELANQTIVDNGFRPTTIKEYADAVFQTKKKVWAEIQSKLDEGQAAGLEIDLDSIGLKILDIAEDPALARVNPNAVNQLTAIVENLTKTGGKVDILEAERIKQFINADLADAFGKTDLSQPAKEAQKLITKEIGKQLDEKLTQIPGEFRDLKIKYGSLSAIEEDILKRAIVFERQNPEGLADILTKTQAAGDIAFGSPAGKARAVARLTLQAQLKKANDADDLIKRAFEQLSPKGKGRIPGTTIVDDLATQARKFDTAEEFIKNTNNFEKVFHSGVDIKEIKIDKSKFGDVFFVSENKEFAKSFGGKTAKLNELFLDGNANLVDLVDLDGKTFDKIKAVVDKRTRTFDNKGITIKEAIGKELNFNPFSKETVLQGIKDGKAYFAELPAMQEVYKELGFDGMITQELKGASNIGIFNPDILKTKQQLIDIFEQAKKPVPIFQGFTDLTTGILDRLKGKSVTSKQEILNFTNMPEIKQVDKDIVRRVVNEFQGGKVPVQEFAERVKSELIPLTTLESSNASYAARAHDNVRRPLYEDNYTLPEELRGNVADYGERIYKQPFEVATDPGHFPGLNDKMFGWARYEDLAKSVWDGKKWIPQESAGTRRVLEVQSYIYQRGRLESSVNRFDDLINKKNALLERQFAFEEAPTPELKSHIDELKSAIEKIEKGKNEVLEKLQQYNNPTAHFRIIREELKNAAQAGKKKVQFPTGETAMKIEGLGGKHNWRHSNGDMFSVDELKVGKTIKQVQNNFEADSWVITDVLENGKFKAIQKQHFDVLPISVDEAIKKNANNKSWDQLKEQFDISGAIDKTNPIYKFYEKDVAKFLKNQFDAKLITDPQGVKWMEVDLKPSFKTLPIKALGLTGAVASAPLFVDQILE